MPPDERRAAIVEATIPLVLEHGHGVTVRMIAEAAGVAEGTIFTVFRDKDALMLAVRERTFDAEPALRALAAIDLAAPLRTRMLAVVGIVSDQLQRAFLLITALGLTGPPKDRESESRRREINNSFTAAIVALIEPDAPALSVSPQHVAHVLRLLIFSACHPVINDGCPLSAEQIVDSVLDGARRREPASDEPARPAHHHELSTTGGN
jgi:AcrR family transcriptional regulator